jgi:uncharacterized protein
MRPRRALRLGACFLFGYVTFCLIAGVFIAEGTLHPARRWLTDVDRQQAQIVALRHDAEITDITVTGLGGVNLSAWMIRPRSSTGQAVILLHGLADNRMGMIGYAELFLMHGFSVLMPDARAHGASGGPLATYGLLESDDVRLWLDWIAQNFRPSCVFGFGESMGAAQLLQSLGTERHFCAVAAESPFSNFREIAYDRVGQFFHTGPWLGRSVLRPVVEVAFEYPRWKYKMNFEQVSPEEVVAKSMVPILLIHGQQDSNIPVRHSRRIATENQDVRLWEVPGADHCGAISVAPRAFEARVMEWYQQHSNR